MPRSTRATPQWGRNNFDVSKGQIKRKKFGRTVDSPKTNKFVLFAVKSKKANKTNSFVRFWENLQRANLLSVFSDLYRMPNLKFYTKILFSFTFKPATTACGCS